MNFVLSLISLKTTVNITNHISLQSLTTIKINKHYTQYEAPQPTLEIIKGNEHHRHIGNC
jgi:hypothetical protein